MLAFLGICLSIVGALISNTNIILVGIAFILLQLCKNLAILANNIIIASKE